MDARTKEDPLRLAPEVAAAAEKIQQRWAHPERRLTQQEHPVEVTEIETASLRQTDERR